MITVDADGPTPQKPLPPVPPPPMPISVVKLDGLGAKTCLETETVVDHYLARLKSRLLAAIAAGHRTRVE